MSGPNASKIPPYLVNDGSSAQLKKRGELMKQIAEDTQLEESNDDGLLPLIVEIVLPSPGNPGSPNTIHVQQGEGIAWIWNMPATTPPFTVTISPSGTVQPLSYKATFINGRWEASGGTVVGQPGMSCQSQYGGGAATVVPPNVIIVENSTGGIED